MKFDPLAWNEVPTNETFSVPKGVLRLRASAEVPLYIEAHGVEALAGVGTQIEVELSEPARAKVTAPKGIRVFIFEAVPTAVVAQGEVFTNIDRMPTESGPMAEVTRALRVLEMERRAALRDIRNASKEAERARGKPERAQHAQEGDAATVPVEETDDETRQQAQAPVPDDQPGNGKGRKA